MKLHSEAARNFMTLPFSYLEFRIPIATVEIGDVEAFKLVLMRLESLLHRFFCYFRDEEGNKPFLFGIGKPLLLIDL